MTFYCVHHSVSCLVLYNIVLDFFFECIFYYNFYVLMKRQIILNIIEKKGRFQKIKTISHLSQRK